MATQKPLVIGSGTTAQFPSVVGDSLEIDGAVLAKNTTNSLTAFQVQNAAGTVTVLDVDTSNARVGVGTAAPNETLTVNGVVSIAEGASPSNTAAFGKLWASGAADARPYWTDDTGQSYNLTLDRFNTLAYGLTPGSVAIDTSPALPVFNSLALSQNTTFTTNNLGDGRSASVRVIGDASTRTLSWPAGWTWLGSGPPSSLTANDVGYLSITAYGVADTDVVAAWSYENAPAVVIGSGVATQVAYFSSASTVTSETAVGSNSFTWDATNNRLGIGTNAPTTAVDVATGQVAIPDGTAAAPALAFRDDLNTGFYSPSNDIVGIAVNGAEVARFQQSGASSESVMLLGTSTVYGSITVDSSDPSGIAGVVMLGHVAAGTTLQESYRGGQFAGIRTRGTQTAPMQVGTGDGLWNALGVGCYTNDPTPPAYNYGALITFKAEEAYTASASGGRIEFHTTLSGTDGFTTLGSATTERVRITNAGNVGIGTSAPGAKLEVANSDALVYGLTVGRGGGAVSSNTAVGASALTSNTASGTANTAVGGSALATNTAGDQLTAVGFNALTAVTGTANTAVGAGCGQNITSGAANTGVGAFALSGLSAATTGSNNTALGYVALSANTASENTAVGAAALGANTTGTGHVAVGYNALSSTATSANCTAIGHAALAVSTGAGNTAVGARAGGALTTGTSNVAIGVDALGANQTGAGSVAIGDSALALATGSGNVGIGSGAGSAITSGVANVAVGRLALFTASTASSNTAIGDTALRLATGAENTAVGSGAINSLTTGTGNIGIGVGVLTAATTGVDNVAVGNSALASLVSGGENVSVGTLALANNTASGNTAFGNQTAQANTSGASIVAVGASALKANTTAADSTAVGANALASSQGAQNTALGSSAGSTVTSGTNVTLVGYNAQPLAPTSTNEITLGDATVGMVLRCIATTITAISDQRDKAEIQDLTLGLDFLKTVHPVQFKWDRRDWYDGGVSDGSKKLNTFEPGFIAQELDAAQTAANAEWMALALKGNPDRLEATPMRLFPVVVKACQELAAQAAAATARAIEAERRLDALEAALAALSAP